MGLVHRFTLVLTTALGATLGLADACRAAGLVIEALSSTAMPGSVGSFDVVLINTNPAGGGSYDVAADSLDVALSGVAGVTITGVSMNTSANYLFAQSVDRNYGLTFATIDTPPTGFVAGDAGDVAAGYPGYQVVNPLQTYGLAHVTYAVSPTAEFRVGTISIDSLDVGTSLSDPDGGLFSFTGMNGTLTNVATVPEPSALIPGATAAMLGLGAIGWRRWSSARRSDGGAGRGAGS
jgi:hypothetical protein